MSIKRVIKMIDKAKTTLQQASELVEDEDDDLYEALSNIVETLHTISNDLIDGLEDDDED